MVFFLNIMVKRFDWGKYMVQKFQLLIKLILLISVISLNAFAQPILIQAQPSQCTFGEIDAWISINAENWLNTTVSELSLSCGQSFFVKAKMSPSIDDIWLALYLFEPGTTSYNQESFTVIDGPCSLNDGVDLGRTYAFENKTVIWKMKVKDDPVWKSGITPLSLTGFFQKQKDDEWITEDISFSIAAIHILKNETITITSSLDSEPHNKRFISSNLIILPFILLALIGIGFFKQKK